MSERWLFVGVALLLLSFSSTVLAEEPETKKDDEEQHIIIPRSGEIDIPEQGTLFKFSGAAMFAASASDLLTTEYGLKQPGIYEANAFADNRGLRIATHVVAPAVTWWATEKIHKKGRPKLALAIRIGLMVAYSYAAIHNVRTVHGQ
jgi:hypothetical protein